MTNLEAALSYAQVGYPVLPLVAKGKVPLQGGHGAKDASTDPAQITTWFSDHPDLNVGLALPDSVVAIDEDPRHGGDLELLEQQHGVLTGPRQRTGGGGRHVLMRLPPGLGKIKGRIAPGIDLKRKGGYIVAWPSLHESGNFYAWENRLPEPPDQLPIAPASLFAGKTTGRAIDLSVFVSGPAILGSHSGRVTWLISNHLALGTLVELNADPKAGKSTLTLEGWCRALLAGGHFLGVQALKTPVIYLTEEDEATFAPMLTRAGVDQTNLHVLYQHRVFGIPFDSLIDGEVTQLATKVGAKVVVVDTLSEWAGDGDENSSTTAKLAMRPLRKLKALGITVVVVRHATKAAATNTVNAGRGSNQWAGGADVVMNLMDRQGHEDHRILRSKGRIPGIVKEQVIGWSPATGHYSVAVVPDEDIRRTLLDAINQTPGLTRKDLVAEIRDEHVDVTPAKVGKVLTALLAERKLRTEGTGKRGDPWRFFAGNSPSPQATVPVQSNGPTPIAHPVPTVPNWRQP